MASNAMTVVRDDQQLDWSVINAVVTAGDLADLTVPQRTAYYRMFCESLGLNPVTQPFGYFKQNGKLTLYARKEATEQLRKKHHVSLRIVDQQAMDGLYIVTVEASFPDGRVDSDVGAVPLPQSGEPRSNAVMKAITKAKRRVTLSICGLGISDETELESIPGARKVDDPDDENAPAPPREIKQPGRPVEAPRAPSLSEPRKSLSDRERLNRKLWATAIEYYGDGITDSQERRDKAKANLHEWVKVQYDADSLTALSDAQVQEMIDAIEQGVEAEDDATPEQAHLATIREETAVKGLDER